MNRHIAVFAAIVLFGMAVIGMANASDTVKPMTVTPDISVTATATMDVVLPDRAEWLGIKNDCSSDLYFDLEGNKTPDGSNFGLRLKNGESIGMWFETRTITVSPASGNSATCTFTLQAGR